MAATPRRRQRTSPVYCRALGHAWFDIDTHGERSRDWPGVPMWLRCERCDTERHDQIYPDTGELVHREYVYPDSYRSAYARETSRADFRVLLFHEIKQRQETRVR